MQQTFRGKMTAAGRVVIPAELRRAFGLREGEDVLFTRDRESIRITPLKRAIGQAQDFFASLAPSEVVMSEELLRERRDEAADE
jgi:AbrB family looped-hinge helix DNA binding protein